MRRFMRGLALSAMAAMWPAMAQATDQDTAQEIANSLRASGRLVDYSIGVKFEGGTAWLLGRVASEEQAAEAIAMAQELPMVTEVVNKLEVKSTKAPTVRFQEASEAEGDVELAAHRPAPSRAQADPGDPLAASPSAQLKPLPTRQGQSAMALTAGRNPAPTMQGAPRPMGNYQMVSHANAVNAGAMNANAQMAGPSSYGPAATPASYAAGNFDQPHMPNHAWPSYAAYPNYAQVNYPKQYSPTCWPYIGPFYPYPQVPLGWRKVTLEWDDGWWFLDFDDRRKHKRRLGGF